MEPFIHSTRDLREAGFLWSQKQVQVRFRGLEASEQYPGVFKFQFEVLGPREDFEGLLAGYMNQEGSVEPKAYDQKLSNLRDNLRKSKSH